MKDKLKKYLVPWSIVFLTVAAMLYILDTRAPGGAEGSGVTAEELGGFLRSVAAKDFPAMRDAGEKIFTAGRPVPGARTGLAGFATTSHPPNTVYALYTDNLPDRTRRVLLTLDGTDRVVSFLAEEMVVE